MGFEVPVPPGVRRRLTLNPSGVFPFELTRLLDHELRQLASRLRPIEPDYTFAVQPAFSLPATFVGAQLAFGRTSKCFDPDKGSFAFPLMLSGTRDGAPLRYVLRLRDTRGRVDLDFLRYQDDPIETSARSSLPPVDRELSRADLRSMTRGVLDFVAGHGALMMHKAVPFYRVVRSDLIVYGCRSGEAFERCFETHERYEGEVEAIGAALAEDLREQELSQVSALLDDVSRAELRSP